MDFRNGSLSKMMEIETNGHRSNLEAFLEDHPYLQEAMQNIKQVVWVLDLSTERILYVSPAFESVWGRSCESFYLDPLTLIQSVHPEDRVMVMSATLDDFHKTLDQSYRIFRPDGSLRWISTHSFLIREVPSDHAYQICIAEDITDQNRVNQTLRKALDRSREQFNLSRRMSLARKPEVVLRTLMSASELRDADQAFVLFFDSPKGGLSREMDLIASWPPSSYPVNARTNDLVSEVKLNEMTLLEVIGSADLFHPSRPVIFTDLLRDQRLSPEMRDFLLEGQIHTMAIFPLVASGNWLGCLLVLFSEEKHFESVELRHIKVLVDQAAITLYNLQLLETEAESRQEAERANEIKTRFLAMISHELRTPLTSIIGFTSTILAKDVAWEPDEQLDFIRTIQQEADRLQELIDHLLDLSRLEAGMLPIVLASTSLDDVLNDALPQLQTLTNRHTLTVHLPPNLPPVYVDTKRIVQVLVNLVRNAATYSPEGSEIDISANLRRGSIQVNVNDQGPGIPTLERKRVFQAFRRGLSEEGSSRKGAGLGLAICKGLVEAHGGRIWIKKKTTSGTTISFTLPLAPLPLPETIPGER
uniref:histidine kinase n=1 Tax=Anaerolinea thermolimosa TaxID=229919 RepID=A0A7C4KIU6_9CHLR